MRDVSVEAPIRSVLATAWLRIKTGDERFLDIRVICDSGAQMNLLSEDVFRTLNLCRQRNKLKVVGINDTGIRTQGEATLELWHRTHNTMIAQSNFVIIENFGMRHPYQSFSHLPFVGAERSEFADPTYNMPTRVDGIIGVSILAEQIRSGITRNAFGLIAQSTTFGWIVFGGVPNEDVRHETGTIALVTAKDLYIQVRRLWEIDEGPTQAVLTAEDEACEALYRDKVARAENRYSVPLLLKPEQALGESRATALRRLYCLEARFKRNPELRESYIKFMREYEELGHMKRADVLDPVTPHYYIPHHAVAIERKFRVVFDGSAKTTNGKSLNDIQYIGPRLQKDLMDIMMGIRVGRYAITADICKMFRQIMIHPEFWNLTRILWRESPDEPVSEFWLIVITYGLASSPYAAVKTLIQCALDNADEFPRAAQVVQSDFYVDDLLTSVESSGDAIALKAELNALLQRGGFQLAKWRSNCSELMNEQIGAKIVDEQDSTSILGLVWNYRADELQFRVHHRMQPDVITKRVITSEAARVFDPQGYVAPVTIGAKLFIQRLWRAKSDWDQPLDSEVQEEWKAFYEKLAMIDRVRIPRWLETTSTSVIQIHIFCDASTQAYGAAAYIRVLSDGRWAANLLCSRSKVAPLKTMTIPKLELCAIDVGCALLQRVRQIPMFSAAATFVWSDSEIALYWLRRPIDRLKIFVANRVKRILQTADIVQTRHIRTEMNPADLLTRPMAPDALIDNQLWWNGPSMLREERTSWPTWNASISDPETREQVNAEFKKADPEIHTVLLASATDRQNAFDLIDRFSSHEKVCRVTAYIIRACNRMFRPVRERRTKCPIVFRLFSTDEWKSDAIMTVECPQGAIDLPRLSIIERENALKYWIRIAQKEFYPVEYKAVSKGDVVSEKSQLRGFTPEMDSDGLLRIRGRLNDTKKSKDEKKPIILHRKCTLASRLAEDSHRKLCHDGVQACTQYLRHKFWIVGARILLRTVVNKCVVCARYRQKAGHQLMADIPAVRLQPAPAFQHTGVDYAGPITLRLSRNKTSKGYIAVFVCMIYKAVHLELVSSMDAESFIAALTRFVNLRAGRVQVMYSDNGTNFVRANRELKEAVELWQNQAVLEHLESYSIQWRFIVPAAPHHGGIWEAAVKKVKFHLKRVGGAHTFTFEELATLLAKIAACINSRPLTPITSDPADLSTLSPGHFITGQAIVTPFEGHLGRYPMNRLDAWQKIQKLQQDFWERWSEEYVLEQQRRNKEAVPCRSMKVGDLVFIRNELTPPSLWLMGRVEQVFLGRDDRVRSCEVRTAKSKLVRPITQLCLLPMDTADDKDI